MIQSNKKKCIVLLSGGLDSATVLKIAQKDFEVVALAFDYGQRHKFELNAAKKIAKHNSIILNEIKIFLRKGKLEPAFSNGLELELKQNDPKISNFNMKFLKKNNKKIRKDFPYENYLRNYEISKPTPKI